MFEDADGSLLVIDTGGWFRIGCPTSQIAKPDVLGGIYRIRPQDGREAGRRSARSDDRLEFALRLTRWQSLLDDAASEFATGRVRPT